MACRAVAAQLSLAKHYSTVGNQAKSVKEANRLLAIVEQIARDEVALRILWDAQKTLGESLPEFFRFIRSAAKESSNQRT